MGVPSNVPLMKISIRAGIVVCLLLLGWGIVLLSARVTRAEDETTSLLVLKNGQVLAGIVRDLGDRYQVTLIGGGEIRVKAGQVEFTADNYDDAFQQKQSRIRLQSVRDRIQLSEWCLRQKLYEKCAEELTAAMYLDPKDPRIATVERRLKAAVRTAKVPEKAMPRVDRIAVDDRFPGSDNNKNMVAPASAQVPVADSVEEAVGDVSRQSLEEFTQSIQPYLLNKCANNGCHGPTDSNELHLIRPPVGKTLVRRLTLRNLNSVLSQIDREQPTLSRLLKVPQRAHGQAKSAVFGATSDPSFVRLAKWVETVGSKQNSSTPEPFSTVSQAAFSGDFLSGQNSDNGDGPSEVPPKQQSPRRLGVGNGNGQETRKGAGSASAAGLGAGRRERSEYLPKDPFDPELFNQRYGTQELPENRR